MSVTKILIKDNFLSVLRVQRHVGILEFSPKKSSGEEDVSA
jgi:hypothetical protein